MVRVSTQAVQVNENRKSVRNASWFPLLVGGVVGFNFAFVTIYMDHVNVVASWMGNFQMPAESDQVLPAPDDKSVYLAHNSMLSGNASERSGQDRILCWVMTMPSNHDRKAKHIKATWGKRCDILLFMSSASDSELPAIALPVEEGRNFLWAKTKEAFRYVYEHHLHEADWFYKADDDTYAILENMRSFLAGYSADDPLYFGCRFKPYTRNGYMSGGAGYILSREALRRFATRGLQDSSKCRRTHGGAEDLEMGKCLERLGVRAGDTRDAQGGYRFHPFRPEVQLQSSKYPATFWYWRYIYYPQKPGLRCCSPTAISFHYVPPNMLHAIDYLLYRLRVKTIQTTAEAAQEVSLVVTQPRRQEEPPDWDVVPGKLPPPS